MSINLNLNYAREARASMDRYLEDCCNAPEAPVSNAEETRWLVQTAVMALVSIAEDLRRITDEETA